MGPSGQATRILQVHASRRCNLSCLHCYSSSSPEEDEGLPLEVLCEALSDASAEGYNVAGFSGGEPLLYKPLAAALAHAQTCGLFTTVTSNGMLLNKKQLERLQGKVNLLAISLDGVPESHNRMRASDSAFATMQANLNHVRDAQIPFGFIFTLTQHNLHELSWVAEFAHAEGAKLLQIHPLEGVGRAATNLAGNQPDTIESAYAFLEFCRLQNQYGDQLSLQLDLADRDLLRADPARGLAAVPDGPAERLTLSDVLSPLVIEPDGWVVPIQYGFDRRHAVGCLKTAPLRDLACHWRGEKEGTFRDLCRQVLAEVTVPTDLPLFNWYEDIARAARAAA